MLAAVRPLVSDIRSTWSVAAVRAALSSHERGEFHQSAQLVEAMGRDDRLSSIIDTRINGVLGAGLDVLPTEENAKSDRAQDVASRALGEFGEMYPTAELASAMRWERMMGFAIGQHVWRREAGAWLPRLRVWSPQWSRYDVDLGQWFVNTRERGEIPIEPGDGTWILFGSCERPYMSGSVRRLAITFLIRQFAIRDWARFSERHGMPIVKAKVPAMVSEEHSAAFFNDLKRMSTETTAVLPQNVDGEGKGSDYDLEMLEARDGSWEAFKALIDQTSDTYAIDILGHNLTSEVRGGSFAAAQTGDSVRDDIKRADAAALSEALHRQSLNWWAKMNVGDPMLAPVPVWRVEPPADLASEAAALKTVGEALQAIREAGYSVADPEAFGEKFGIELAKVEPVADGSKSEFDDMGDSMTDDELTDDESETLHAVADALDLQPVRLASGDDPDDARGFIEGQLYADALADDAVPRGKRALAVDLKVVLDIIDSSTDYSDLRVRLREVYADMSADAFSRVLEKALVLGDLAGHHAVLQDV